MAKVYHAEIFGLREAKYEWLNKHNIKNVKWNKLEPYGEFYLYIPQDAKLQSKYQKFQKITEIFPINSIGVVTSRDHFIFDIEINKLINRLTIFFNQSISDDVIRISFKLKDTSGWKLTESRKNLLQGGFIKEKINNIFYKPFDLRKIYYEDKLIERSRKEVVKNIINLENLCFIYTRSATKQLPYNHIFVSNAAPLGRFFTDASCITYFSPLYLYPETDKKDLFSEHDPGEKTPNIKPELFEELKTNFKKEITPEEIFYYIYALLYSNTYRTKYSEFLKIDFPRVPFTKDYNLFIRLGKLGEQLVDLHLHKSKELDKTISKFPAAGNNKVEKPRFDPAQRNNGQIWINKEQYFDGIKEEVWQYQIGGYQVCDKWLKDRKERTLTSEEIKTYCKIVTALSKTIELQKEIDKYYPEIEKSL